METDTPRIAIVGASSGIGRSLAQGLAARGARLALLARREDRLAALVERIGGGAVALRCDVTDPSSCTSSVDGAAARLGGLDALVYTAGIGRLRRLVDIDQQTWREVFDTNVIGAALVTAAAVPHLQATEGTAAYLSSVSASMTAPWAGLGSYAASKAALDKLIEAWRAEHPRIGFSRVVVGDCAGGDGEEVSEFANAWDPALAGELAPDWLARGQLTGALVEVADVIRVVDMVVRAGAGACIPSVTITPKPPA